MTCSLDISSFLDEISSLSHSIVILYFFALFIEEGFLIDIFLLLSGTLHSAGYIFPFLPCFLLLFFPQLCVNPPQATTLPSCISFSLGWFWSLFPVQCHYIPVNFISDIIQVNSLFLRSHLPLGAKCQLFENSNDAFSQ